MTFSEQRKLMREEQRAAERRARQQQRREQAWSAAQAQRQMEFQERMSSTAHTREMADLQAAGLNPVLTATGGSGASAPTGASADSSSMLNVIQSLSSSIPSMAMAAEQSARTAKSAVRVIKKADDPPTDHNKDPETTSPNTGLQNLDFTEAVKPAYDFGNEHLNNIFEHLGNKPSGVLEGWSIGDMMIAGAETIGLATDAGEIVGNAIVDAAVKGANREWEKIPKEERDIVTKYLSRHFEQVDPRRSWFGTYNRKDMNMIETHNAKQKDVLTVRDMQFRNSLDDFADSLRKMRFDTDYFKGKKPVKKYRNRYHAKRSP